MRPDNGLQASDLLAQIYWPQEASSSRGVTKSCAIAARSSPFDRRPSAESHLIDVTVGVYSPSVVSGRFCLEKGDTPIGRGVREGTR